MMYINCCWNAKDLLAFAQREGGVAYKIVTLKQAVAHGVKTCP